MLTPDETVQNLDCPFGFIGFELQGVGEGATVPVTVTLAGDEATVLYGFGPRNGGTEAEWYLLGGHGGRVGSARFEGKEVTLLLTDGSSGDHDPRTASLFSRAVRRCPVLVPMGWASRTPRSKRFDPGWLS